MIDKMYMMFPSFTFDDGKLKYNSDLTIKEGLQNNLIELYKSVLLSSSNILEVMEPVDVPFLQKEILKVTEKSPRTSLDEFDSYADIQDRYALLAGKAGVGLEANMLVDINRPGSLELLYASRMYNPFETDSDNIQLDPQYSEKLSEEDLNYYVSTMLKDSASPEEISRFKDTIRAIKPSSTMTAILNAFVDIAKDPYITRGNWTTATTNTGNLLIRMGVHPLKVINFLSQESIRNYIDFIDSYENSFTVQTRSTKDAYIDQIVKDTVNDPVKLKQLVNSSENYADLASEYNIVELHNDFGKFKMFDLFKTMFIEKYGKENVTEKTLNSAYSILNYPLDVERAEVSTLESFQRLRKENINPNKDIFYQLDIFNEFLALQGVSKEVGKNINLSKLDTSGLKSPTYVYHFNNLRESLKQSVRNADGSKVVISGVESKFQNTVLDKIYNNVITKMLPIISNNAFLFPEGSVKVQKLFNIISQSIYKEPLINESLRDTLNIEFNTYLLSKVMNISRQELNDLYANLPDEFLKFQKANPNKYEIIDQLQFRPTEIGSIIAMNSRKKTPEQDDNIVRSWLELRNDHPELSDKLFKYSFITSGYTMSPIQFFTYIPNEFLVNKGYERKISSVMKSDLNEFVELFFRNTTENKFIQKIFDDSIQSIEGNSKRLTDAERYVFKLKESKESPLFVRRSEKNPETKETSDVIYKLIGYDVFNHPIYTRSTKLGRHAEGINIHRYNDVSSDEKDIPEQYRELYLSAKRKVRADSDIYAFNNHYELPDSVRENKITVSSNETIIDSKINSIDELTNHSGGAYGGDTFWDLIGREFGVTNHKHYKDAGNTNLSQQLKNKGIKAEILTKEQMEFARRKVKELLGIEYKNDLKGNLQVRNFYQVYNADAVYAVAKLDTDKEFDSTAVLGGTNTAVQLGIKLNKPVYVWDIFTEQWYKFNGQIFEKTEIPALTKNFAGIGSRDIENYNVQKEGKWRPREEYVGKDKEQKAKQAIRDVYQATLNNIESAKPINTSTQETIPSDNEINSPEGRPDIDLTGECK